MMMMMMMMMIMMMMMMMIMMIMMIMMMMMIVMIMMMMVMMIMMMVMASPWLRPPHGGQRTQRYTALKLITIHFPEIYYITIEARIVSKK